MTARDLTYDQRKAAEAAFRGLPSDPRWSAAAQSVYEGIVHAARGKVVVADEEFARFLECESRGPESDGPAEAVSSAGEAGAEERSEEVEAGKETDVPDGKQDSAAAFGSMTREEAVEAGFLIDVTSVAKEVGLSLPVSLTKPAWEIGITAGHQLPEEEYRDRARDVLMALRLFLERATSINPLMEFPALLSFPPEATPQLCSLYVLAHKDPSAPYSLTILLPREISVIKGLSAN